MRKSLFLILVLVSAHNFGQENYPKDFFGSPMDIPIILAGTFGELRSNHFHSGIDIKTQQREGLPIYGVAEGTVTRIKVSHWGYGKVIYVAHPNGYTSVYGHLQKFSPEIEEYIKKIQYAKKSYEVEIFPDFGEIKVQKGQVIAYSGNTGGSSGPHLHFEIRNTVSEKPTNPLLYGFEVRDATPPIIEKLYGYPLAGDAQINKSNDRVAINFTRQKNGTLLADKVTAVGTIGFGFIGYDRQDLAANKNGLYSVQQFVNGTLYSEYDFDTFSFVETRYLNTLIDYSYYASSRQMVQQCFRVPGNNLSIYNELHNNGKIAVVDGLAYTIEILVRDLAGNMTKMVIPVEGKKEELKIAKEEIKTENFIVAKKPNNYDLGVAKVYFPANTFYDDFYIDLKKGADTVMIHNGKVPAHRNFTITFDASKYSEKDRERLFIAKLNNRSRPSYEPTFKRGASFTARTRNLGTYTLAMDTVPPKIWPKNFKEKQWLNNYRYLSLHISDDLSGINTYTATLNGEWILMEYEPKTNTITYNFDDRILDQKQCALKVIVTDNVGNSTTFEADFFRK